MCKVQDQLPLKTDPIVLDRLNRAVEFLHHALSHIPAGTVVDRMIAIHGLDNSVEYLLRIVLDALDVEARTGRNLDTLELASLMSELHVFLADEYELRLPYRTEVKKLRQLRNLVQHGMVDPVSELDHLRTIVNRLFHFVFENIFSLDPAYLRISQLIKDPFVRDLLGEAEELTEDGRYLEAIVASRDAFDNALHERRRLSDLRWNSIPILVESDDDERNYFYTSLVEEVELQKLGVDSRRADRFKDYVRHIPQEHRASFSGNVIMQRPWEREDAEFCYRFVSETVMAWQRGEFEPLYERNASDLPTWREEFAGIALPSEGTVISYTLQDFEGQIDVLVVEKDEMERLQDLPLGREYDKVTESVSSDGKRSHMYQRCELVSRMVRLVTHRPARWECALKLRDVALTWHRKEFEDGELVQESPCINTASAEELTSIYTMDEDIAAAVVKVRAEHGRFRTRTDVAKVPGISEKQVQWLCRFTRADP